MGMVTIHLVLGVGVLILPLFLVIFSIYTMSIANLYIIIGAISFVTSIVTAILLVTKFINQPAAHGFFSYSDTLASAILSLGLLLDGVMVATKVIFKKFFLMLLSILLNFFFFR